MRARAVRVGLLAYAACLVAGVLVPLAEDRMIQAVRGGGGSIGRLIDAFVWAYVAIDLVAILALLGVANGPRGARTSGLAFGAAAAAGAELALLAGEQWL